VSAPHSPFLANECGETWVVKEIGGIGKIEEIIARGYLLVSNGCLLPIRLL